MNRLFIFLLSSFLVITTAFAKDEYIAADKVSLKTPTYRPSFDQFEPKTGTYRYEVSWQGIPAAELKVEVRNRNVSYQVIATARTFSAIDLFYKLRYRVEGIMSSLDFAPRLAMIDHKENSRHKRTRITFAKDGDIRAVNERVDKNEKQELTFNTKNFTLDPISAAFVARGLPWKLGAKHEFDAFNGKSRYLITLTAKEKKMVKIDGKKQEAWVIAPTVINKTKPKQTKKLRSAQIYLSTDKRREILQIKSEVFIGSVKTKLIDFKADGEAGASIVALK